MDSSCARRDAFTDSAISAKVNGEHKEKDLEPWDAGKLTTSEELEALENDVSNGWDPNDMFRYNEENYGVVSTYDSSLSSYTVPLERDNSEEFLKREARANQLAEEIESSAQYKARVALENDDRSEEEKYTAVQRNSSEQRDNSEEFLKREARANQLAEEIESSAQYKARVALENDDRSEEEKYTAVQRNSSERESHSINTRENKCFP
ncbi:Ataxin-2 [Myotis brandtii]|uniref:Ataxin-2 n=1 Tax=Myotis brandtii TaxID=109478 RepID=S7NXC2_MYOBR|nr:Ataxin-2 [Myotis brandtii]